MTLGKKRTRMSIGDSRRTTVINVCDVIREMPTRLNPINDAEFLIFTKFATWSQYTGLSYERSWLLLVIECPNGQNLIRLQYTYSFERWTKFFCPPYTES